MAKYIRNEVVEAAQWDPTDSEPARMILARLGKKVKKCTLVKEIPSVRLGTPGNISIEGLNLSVTVGKTVFNAAPTEYLLIENGTLKVMNRVRFEAQYKPESEEEPGTGSEENGGEPAKARVLRMVKR